MGTKKSLILLVLIIALIFSNCVQAASISFIDSAYVNNGTLKISAPNGDPLDTLVNSTQVFEVNNQSAYMLDYQAGGLFQLNQEKFWSYEDGNWTGPEFNAAHFYISWFGQLPNIVNTLWLICLVLVVLLA